MPSLPVFLSAYQNDSGEKRAEALCLHVGVTDRSIIVF